jgi:hypothetical protein
MAEPMAVAVVNTNTTRDSLVRVEHAAPTVALHGRIAGGAVGRLSLPRPALHLTIVISDPYSGIFGIDGQPTDDAHITLSRIGESLSHFKLIRVKFYYNELPTKTEIRLPVEPPHGMSGQVFAQALMRKAYDFVSYSLPYRFPKHIVRDVMVEGEYNSSSFAAGLLLSVMGYLPRIETPGFQTPGWDQPIPSSYFKGEALR